VILDTTTPLLTVTCVGCTSCTPSQNPPFDPLASAGCVAAACASPAFPSGCNSRQQVQFNLSYTDGSSLLGVVYEDVVWVGDSPGSSFPFGCTTVERSTLRCVALRCVALRCNVPMVGWVVLCVTRLSVPG
jgi:hypothetical protein